MRLAIIKGANLVEIDGKQNPADLNAMPADVVALHWDGTHGQIEYDNSHAKTPWDDRKGNDHITQLPEWAGQVMADTEKKPKLMALALGTEEEEQAKRDAAMAKGKADAEAREAKLIEKLAKHMKDNFDIKEKTKP